MSISKRRIRFLIISITTLVVIGIYYAVGTGIRQSQGNINENIALPEFINEWSISNNTFHIHLNEYFIWDLGDRGSDTYERVQQTLRVAIDGWSCPSLVEGTVAAILVDRQAASNTLVPITVAQWVSFLGTPTLVSWHQQMNMRVLHWPQYGTSVTVYLYEGLANSADTEWIYFYPFREGNYEELWPVNSILKTQPFATEMPDLELEVLDFEAIQTTVAADSLWPTVTPRATSAPG